MRDWQRFIPAGVLFGGCLLLLSVQSQRTMALQAPLSGVPAPIAGLRAEEVIVPDDQVRIAGMTSYVNRVFYRDSVPAFGMYVGFYQAQSQGKTVHSPKNCLPGAGWEQVSGGRVTIATPSGPAEVNRFLIAKGNAQALVYYWYQGRGRIAANEYAVKWDLLRDAAIARRTDEALVRIVVPVVVEGAGGATQANAAIALEAAELLARDAATSLAASLERFLPG